MMQRRPRSRADVGHVVAGLSSFAFTSWVSATVWACPSCPVGRTARQQVLDQEFETNLMIALLPSLVVGLVSRWAERIGSRSRAPESQEGRR